MKSLFILFIALFAGGHFPQSICIQENRFPALKGPYLGQSPPGATKTIFAPGIVSTAAYNHSSVTISSDGTEIYWSGENENLGHNVIWVSRLVDGCWSKPVFMEFTKENDGDCPMLSHDDKRLFFLSSRALEQDNNKKRERIWYTDRTAGGWSEPVCVDMVINGDHLHWQVSVDKDLNIYFASERAGSKGQDDIFFSEYGRGRYSTPVSLDENINSEELETTPFISRDGSYLIFGRNGMYISYKDTNGKWTKSRKMGSQYGDCCPFVSPDGKYFFFKQSGIDTFRNIYWIDAKIIEELRPKRQSD